MMRRKHGAIKIEKAPGDRWREFDFDRVQAEAWVYCEKCGWRRFEQKWESQHKHTSPHN